MPEARDLPRPIFLGLACALPLALFAIHRELGHAGDLGFFHEWYLAFREGSPLPIPYSLAELDTPVRLVAQLARGVAHYLEQHAESDPPGGPDAREAVIDVLTVMLGFGVFLANAASQARAFESGGLVGFGYSRLGALTQHEISYALAARAIMVGADHDGVRAHLTPNPRGFYDDALRELARRGDRFDAIASTAARGDGPYR